MDVTKPELLWLDGICCRVRCTNKFSTQYNSDVPTNVDKADLYEDDNDESEDELDYITLDNGRVKSTILVAQCFLGYLIGAKGATKKRIETETRTDIKIPPRGQTGQITVSGWDKKSVSTAIRRIKLIIIGARQKQSITHFISIPIHSNIIKENFQKFKDEILESSWGKQIDPTLFTLPEKLHITLVTMFLADDEERNIAKTILQQSYHSIIKNHFENNKNTSLKIKDVSYMNDDPKAVNVLYAEVHEDFNLKELAGKLKQCYEKTGLLSRNKDNIKLHVTLMNTSNTNVIENEGNFNKRATFDASNILQNLKNYDFGDQVLKEIHLSQRGTLAADGYYQPTCVLSL